MQRFEREGSPLFHVAIAASLAAVFGLDALVPLGVSPWIFYFIPMGLTLFLWRPNAPLLVAAGCTGLLVMGTVISAPPLDGAPSGPQVNRAMAVLAVWMLALTARVFILTRLSVREQEWVRSGQRELGLQIQGDPSLAQLGERALRFLCDYLGVSVGVFYATEPGGASLRVGTYGLAATDGARERVAPGEGLLGQAIKDARVLRADDVPPGYLDVSSTLGRTPPRHLLAIPASVGGRVRGAIELGYLRPPGQSDLDLLGEVAEQLAVAIRSAEDRARLEALLARTQSQAEELQVQQEELRLSNEELETHTQALRDSQARLETQQTEMEEVNAQLEEQTQALEEQRDDLARAQAALVERSSELGRANRYKSEFLANMSHEIRTPLNSLLILAKLLADNERGNLDAEQVKYATMIHQAGNDLLALLNDILDLSRIEAGRTDIEPARVELAPLLKTLEGTYRAVAVEKGLELYATLEPGAVSTITTDPLRLQQILRNLLANAIKFTESGEVSLRVAQDGPAWVRFVVRDTGAGIAKEHCKVIFEAFRQADSSTQRSHGGTGLGLAISRELAQRLGGELTVESALGEGSAFTLALPTLLPEGDAEPRADVARRGDGAGREDGAPRAAGEALARSVAGGAGGDGASEAAPEVEDDRERLGPGERTILVIEDDARFASVVRDLAREMHFRCLVATTAREGRALAARFAPNAVVLDVFLPDDSGLAVLEHLKGDPATRHIPVHVISGAHCRQQALELGAVGYALKPVLREQLLRTFEELERRLDQEVRRVLVVGDTTTQRESVVAFLRLDGIEPVVAATGAEALALLGEHTFDCVVLGLSLPDMSGYEVLDAMAAEEAFSFPPVIVYPGRALTREEEQRLRRYSSSVIVKGARSLERVLDEVTLFLHQVEAELPPEQRRLLREVRSREAALEGRRILVVEDDVRNVFALASVLEPRGAQLRIARNGREALEALEQAGEDPDAGVDLVLMDIMMPEMDGLTATREIRKQPEWDRLPIIALTAKAMPQDRDQCLEAGANDYITKPLDVERLLSLIKVWLPK